MWPSLCPLPQTSVRLLCAPPSPGPGSDSKLRGNPGDHPFRSGPSSPVTGRPSLALRVSCADHPLVDVSWWSRPAEAHPGGGGLGPARCAVAPGVELLSRLACWSCVDRTDQSGKTGPRASGSSVVFPSFLLRVRRRARRPCRFLGVSSSGSRPGMEEWVIVCPC